MPNTVDRRFSCILLLSLGLHGLLLLGLPDLRQRPGALAVAAGERGASQHRSLVAVLARPSATTTAQQLPPTRQRAAAPLPRRPAAPPALVAAAPLIRPAPALLSRRAEARPTASAALPAAASLPAPNVANAISASSGPVLTALAPAPLAPAAEAVNPPLPGPVLAGAGEALLDAYRRQLQALVSAPRDYPRLAALRGWEGEVRLRLRIARKGNLLAVQLDRSSGFEVLDQHALARLADHGDFPPLPERWEGGELQVVIPIHYKLRKTT
ncbi:energy transducer TonB [Dechloromonas sp. ZY10]|uniref:energy transducer TonB n=1 Tax=Dechloromonas aquae TaxID=2664436 RepID=UPI0035270055